MLTLQPIDYIGKAPRKKKKSRRKLRNFFGGLLLLMLVGGISFYFVEPLVPFLQLQQSRPSAKNAKRAILELNASGEFQKKLAAAALDRTREEVEFDPSYRDLPYPGGDIPADKGMCSDLVVRSYRKLGIDLQQLVHEDMREHFRIYPQLWRAKKPDTNIDHRRVPNLQRYFSRNGQELPATFVMDDYDYGDVVTWRLPFGEDGDGASHIGIVVPGPGAKKDEKWVVHNIGSGPEWKDDLFSYALVGHFRFAPPSGPLAVTAETKASPSATTAQN